MSLFEILAGCFVYAVGCTLQGVLGFGANLLAVPILALINPDFVPGPVLLINPILSGFFTLREKGNTDKYGLTWTVIGRLPGIALAVLALSVVAEERIGVLFGSLLLFAIALRLSGLKFKRSQKNLMVAGCVSGFMGTSVGVGGPPIALLYHDVSGSVLRATLSPYFLIGTIISISALALTGNFDSGDLLTSIYLLPSVMIGMAVSGPLRKKLDHKWITNGIYLLSGTAAITLLIRSLI